MDETSPTFRHYASRKTEESSGRVNLSHPEAGYEFATPPSLQAVIDVLKFYDSEKNAEASELKYMTVSKKATGKIKEKAFTPIIQFGLAPPKVAVTDPSLFQRPDHLEPVNQYIYN